MDLIPSLEQIPLVMSWTQQCSTLGGGRADRISNGAFHYFWATFVNCTFRTVFRCFVHDTIRKRWEKDGEGRVGRVQSSYRPEKEVDTKNYLARSVETRIT